MDRGMGVGLAGLAVAALAWAAHALFLLFLLGGGYLAWRWSWLLVLHIGVALWSVLIVTTRRPCPLTALENWGRARAGRSRVDERGFIPHYLEGHLYPVSWARGVELAAALVVLVSWVGFAVLAVAG